MAMKTILSHPDDNDATIAHVVSGALQVQEINPANLLGDPFSARRSTFALVNAAKVPILSVQPELAGSLEMVLQQLEVYNDGQGIAIVDLIHGGTLTGPSFATVDVGSDFEFDVAATAVTGGRVIRSLFVGRDTTGRLFDNLNSALEISAASPGILTVAVTNLSKSVNVLAAMSWLEK